MLVDELYSALRQYKADTNYIATWLATTAKAHGSKLENLGPPKPPGRPKGKARKQAKQASDKSTDRTYVIAIRDFVPLAEYISNHNPPIPVPESLAASLRRAIKSRGEFGGRLRKYGYDLDALADDSHEHFVGILARVCNVLRPRMTFKQKPTDKQDASCDTANDFANYFGHLSIEEPPESYDNDSNIPTPDYVDMSSGQGQYIAEEQTTREDALFALYKVVGDVSEIKRHIIEAWGQVFIKDEDYTYYPLTSAALFTSLGIELARDLFEEITEMCEKHGGIRHLLEVLCAATAYASGLPEEQIWEKDDEGEQLNSAYMYCFEERYLITPLAFLSVYMEGKSPISCDINAADIFPPESELSGREKEIADVILLHWYFNESNLHTSSWEMVAQDEVMKALKNIHELSSEPVHVAFAGQIFLDLHHLYGKNILKASEHMIQQMGYMQNELRCYKRSGNSHRCSNQQTNKSKHENLEKISTLLDKFIAEVIAPSKEFARCNPILCGLALFFFQSELEEYGIDMLNADPTVITSTHLYNALWQEQVLSEPWPDLDVLMMILPKSSFFVGEDRPSALGSYQKRYLLQLGIPASAFAPDCKRLKNIQGTVKQRQIKPRNEFMRLFSDKYKPKKNMTSSHWTKKFVESLLDVATHKEIFSELGESTGNVKSHQIMMTSGEVRQRSRSLKHSTRPCLSVNDLLLALRKLLLSETTCFVFPYLTILRTARVCLERVRDACEPFLERAYIGYNCDANRHDHFVSCLFGAAVKGISSSGSRIDLLREAAAAMSKFIGSGPNEQVVAELRDWTKIKELFIGGNDGDDAKATEDDEKIHESKA
ncbi:uncharacterized protein F4807DRAFT_472383 [Annulohypoxylon truncatum]|uniref:uncharacterized protein n=1 Tax=Annulohypoxylon truncatum TaxID=327061 RepID=UPI00200839BD|nr:uncharacterized protein F4807DRAFT_472383 [Annulohypoxylon truncatum]KAI1204236.1 hypothetical protein F4807DRAFT_472383 [Annulohypoxylon truncatum]